MYTKESVISAYRSIGSIRGTARHTGVNEQTVRRIVIESGDYVSEQSIEINRRVAAGESVEDIAEALGMRPKTVLCYLPYKKGLYVVGEKSPNAKRIAECRLRKSQNN
ncbi:MAG: hypothetical protein LUD69_04450 [Oscillospiraceae bacterium]|nr:hypothetical protein [Oscillospiraceae bacterium]